MGNSGNTEKENIESIAPSIETPQPSPLSPWTNYYERKMTKYGGPINYQERREKENIPYLNAVEQEMEHVGKRLGIIGIGAGLEVAKFAEETDKCVAMDLEFDTHDLVDRNLEAQNKDPANAEHMVAYMDVIPLATNSLDVICSHGLLEHQKTIEEIERHIQEVLRVATSYVFVVPTDLAGNDEIRNQLGLSPRTNWNVTGNFGDERYMPAEEWLEIIQECISEIPDARITMKFGYWIPDFAPNNEETTKSPPTFTHPDDPTQYFGKGVYAGFVITRSPEN